MSNVTIEINERAFHEAMIFALGATGERARELVVMNTPRDIDRPPINNFDRKDGQRPKRKGGVTFLNGHWYAAVTGNLKRSIAYHVDEKIMAVEVGVSRQGTASEYAEFLEGSPDTPSKKGIRPFISYTLENDTVQIDLKETFEKAFYTYLQKFND